jgi:hypothetical protein
MVTLFSDKFSTGLLKYGRRKYLQTIDGRKIGMVLATKNDGYDTYALNQGEFEDLLEAKRKGRIDEAKVVAAHVVGPVTQHPGENLAHCGEIDAELLATKLKNEKPRNGQFGPFYALEAYVFLGEDAAF